MQAKWIIEQFEEWSPCESAEEWDNVGLIIGDAQQEIKKILVALDATDAVINEAITGGYDFLICHHPIIYNPVKKITSDDYTGRKIIALIKNGIGCYAAHTNLDKASGGVNDCLAEKIGLKNCTPLTEENIGRVGYLSQKMKLSEFYEMLKNSLNIEIVRFCGNADKIIEKVGICGGDGSNPKYINTAIALGCDAYVTGDLRYHAAQEAIENGIALVDITHYGGEVLIINEIVSRLKNAAGNTLEIFPSSIDAQVFQM